MTTTWTARPGFEDIRYETADAIAKITIARPEVRNAFRPETVRAMQAAFASPEAAEAAKQLMTFAKGLVSMYTAVVVDDRGQPS